ncbi:MAG: hypothetical protein ACKVOE_01135 [Rickettsiales bacterium]
MFDRLMDFPTSCNAKMAYGILSAFVARGFVNEAVLHMQDDPKTALMSGLMAAFMVYTVGLALARFNTNRPLFEPLRRR